MSAANPILPEWHTHVSNVAADIVSNYDVDGIHLDYVRWLGDTSWASLPHDSQSHQLFTDATGLSATSGNANAYRQFIRDQITSLVTQVGSTVDSIDPAADFSAAVWRDPDVGSSQVLQEYRTWMEQDLVDTIIPMIYLSPSNNQLFEPNLSNIMSTSTNARVVPGLGIYLHDDPAFSVSQLQTLNNYGTDGAAFFGYNSFFGAGQLGTDRINAITAYYDSLNNGGGDDRLVSITDFNVDEGYFSSSATFSGSNSGINSASADRITSDAFEGVGSQQISIDGSDGGWFLRHVSGIGSSAQIAAPSGNLAIDSTGHVGFWLKTTDDGISVQIAVDDPGTADRGVVKSVIADGEWHLYEWNLEDNSQWDGWVTGDGAITGATVTLDSIQFFGAGDATILLDAVGQNPNGSLWNVYVNGDFDDNGVFDCGDVDALVAEITGGSTDMQFDLNADGVVDTGDLTQWLADAGAANLDSEASYLVGDANLDGVVDISDFNAWNNNKFTSAPGYCGGDFNADGVADASDFNVWNSNKFRSAGEIATVPEPNACLVLIGWFGFLILRRRSR